MKLTLVINIINGWNRLAVGFGLWLDHPAREDACVTRRPKRTRRRSSIRCVRA